MLWAREKHLYTFMTVAVSCGQTPVVYLAQRKSRSSNAAPALSPSKIELLELKLG